MCSLAPLLSLPSRWLQPARPRGCPRARRQQRTARQSRLANKQPCSNNRARNASSRHRVTLARAPLRRDGAPRAPRPRPRRGAVRSPRGAPRGVPRRAARRRTRRQGHPRLARRTCTTPAGSVREPSPVTARRRPARHGSYLLTRLYVAPVRPECVIPRDGGRRRPLTRASTPAPSDAARRGQLRGGARRGRDGAQGLPRGGHRSWAQVSQGRGERGVGWRRWPAGGGGWDCEDLRRGGRCAPLWPLCRRPTPVIPCQGALALTDA